MAVLVKLSAIDALFGVRVDLEAPFLDRQAALDANAVVAGFEALQATKPATLKP